MWLPSSSGQPRNTTGHPKWEPWTGHPVGNCTLKQYCKTPSCQSRATNLRTVVAQWTTRSENDLSVPECMSNTAVYIKVYTTHLISHAYECPFSLKRSIMKIHVHKICIYCHSLAFTKTVSRRETDRRITQKIN